MEKLKLLLLAFFIGFSINSWAQNTQVSGVVLDEQGMPLPAANVLESGTNNGVGTDSDGKFKIALSNKNAVLVVSFVGFVEQRVKVDGSKTNYTIKLASGSTTLEQVVVMGYGKGSRKNLTTSVASVKADQLNNGVISDVGQLLQGKVAGLNVSTSGDPTRGSSVVLRGASTLNSSQGPFYVVDGIPGVDISIIAPEDIVSIDVLKDAAATAIYGNRAANGVIMVTTKRGSKNVDSLLIHNLEGQSAFPEKLEVVKKK